MARRILRISLLAVLTVAFIVAAAWAFVFWTTPGRSIVKSIAENAFGGALGGDAAIGALEGDLPGAVVLRDVRMTDSGDVWLTIDRVEIDWRPFGLLRRAIRIDRARLDGAHLVKAPPTRSQRDRPRGFELPETLPRIAIHDLAISNFRVGEALTGGEEARLDAAGAVKMGGETLNIRLNARSSGGRDDISALIERSGGALSTDVVIRSGADGALASIAGLGGPIMIEAEGNGSLSDYRLDVEASLGAIGAVDGVIAGDLERMEKIHVEADAELGERLSGASKIIGRSASLKGAFSPARNGGGVEIERFRSDLGVVAGTAQWRNRNDVLAALTIDVEARLDDDWRPDLRRYIGDALRINGEIRPKGRAYLATAAVDADAFDGALKNVATDLRAYARGPVELALAANDALPPGLESGAEAAGVFNFVFGKSVEASRLTLTTADGASFEGEAGYEFASEAFYARGDAAIPPAMIANVNRNLSADSKATASIDIKGVAENFSGAIDAATPAIAYAGDPIPPARIELAFAGMPDAPSGRIKARAVDGSLRLDAGFARGENGAWRADDIEYAGANFTLKGSASIAPASNEVALDLVYLGEAGAEPFPGLLLAGDLSAKGAIARGASANRLTIRSGSLASEAWSVEALDATAVGPADALSIKASAQTVAINGVAQISGLETEMTAALEDKVRLTATRFDASIVGARVKLTAPARIGFAEGVAVENLRATIGRRGSLAFDGRFDEARWRGELVVHRAPITNAASVFDIDLDLDTDRKTPAAGTFEISSLLTETDRATISGRFDWDGNTLSINDDGSTDALDLTLSLPVRLVRKPAIGVRIEGPLDGEAHYEGRLETVAAFLPAALQAMDGALVVDGAVSGTIANPELTGQLTLANGAFTELATGLSIVNIDATANAKSAAAGSRVEFDAAGSGPGQSEKTISAKGVATLGENARVSSTITFDGARLSAGPITDVEASGDIDLSGPFSDLLAKGEITVRRLDAQVFTPESTGLVEIRVVALDEAGKPEQVAARAAAITSLRYDLAVKGDDRIFIRGRGLTSEWRADIQIEGRSDDPLILGSMTMREGDITFSGRRFDLTKGAIEFDRLSPNNPSLDIRAERETASGTLAAIVIEGRAKSPRITLESTPPLPQEDIMALVLFDKPASELSAFESLQVAQSLAELGGIGPFGGAGFTSSARQALGLDLLSFDVDESNAAASSLTVGKYVADGLFVSATQDARGQSGSVRIEYEIDDSFTVETELRQDGDQTVSANWKHDF